MKPKQAAFTILELAIVLVVVGLLVGVVMTGKTMLETIKIRKIASEVEELRKGIILFEQRYGAMPGDIKDYSILTNGASACSPVAGNLDGKIGTAADGWTESAQAICQLGNEGMTSPKTSGATGGWFSPLGAFIPSKAYGITKTYGLNYETLGYYIYYRTVVNLPYDAVEVPYVINILGGAGSNCGACADGGLTSFEAYMMDTKLDDGLPRSGKMRASPESDCFWGTDCATPCMPWAYNVTAYQNTTNNAERSCVGIMLDK